MAADSALNHDARVLLVSEYKDTVSKLRRCHAWAVKARHMCVKKGIIKEQDLPPCPCDPDWADLTSNPDQGAETKALLQLARQQLILALHWKRGTEQLINTLRRHAHQAQSASSRRTPSPTSKSLKSGQRLNTEVARNGPSVMVSDDLSLDDHRLAKRKKRRHSNHEWNLLDDASDSPSRDQGGDPSAIDRRQSPRQDDGSFMTKRSRTTSSNVSGSHVNKDPQKSDNENESFDETWARETQLSQRTKFAMLPNQSIPKKTPDRTTKTKVTAREKCERGRSAHSSKSKPRFEKNNDRRDRSLTPEGYWQMGQ